VIIEFGASMMNWSQQSSLAISFSGWVSLISIWLFILTPLTFIGAYFGEKAERIEHPSRTTQIPRMIPKKRWYQLDFIRILLGGIVPFAVVFLNWHELLNSIAKGEYILSINYTIWVSILLLIATAEMTIVLIFLQLCNEDYHWWWQSMMIGGSPALYMFAYGIFYYLQKSNIQGVIGGTIYVVNLLIGCSLIGLCTGTLGFASSYIIIRRIYSTVKVNL
jgi:transmembrane 9 superfamily protein 2/4